ncbi:hypothetical protein MPSEU_000874400 [Mayamaea pseudoterrestris]|nr:hypothetical protein MPSEU_000874400 [Mayamaea pseudoterrestris]
MVVRSGFEVQLVNAVSKVSFKEHDKDGETYVEVEPDVDYFVAIRRINAGPLMVAYIIVDGNNLGYKICYLEYKQVITSEPAYWYTGIWSRIDGEEKRSALRFVKPNWTKEDTGYKELTGYVEVALYEGVANDAKSVEPTNCISKFKPNLMMKVNFECECACMSKKKYLLSAPGSTTPPAPVKSGAKGNENGGTYSTSYTPGALIDRIKLHYCTAVGLTEVGILPKPPLWEYQRLTHPVASGQERARHDVMRHPSVKDKLIEVVDMTDEMLPPLFTW